MDVAKVLDEYAILDFYNSLCLNKSIRSSIQTHRIKRIKVYKKLIIMPLPLLRYLKLQPIDPQDDGSVSDLDTYDEDEVIDLSQDEDGETLLQEWDEISETLHSSREDE